MRISAAAVLTIGLATGLTTGIGLTSAARAKATAPGLQAQRLAQTVVQTVAQVADVLAGADVIILGEVHDNKRHHQVQAEVVAALQPRAVVWEMITQEQAEALTPQILQNPAETAWVLEWEASGWPDFTLYAPVFKRAARAMQFGALVPRAQSKEALQLGVANHFGAQAQQFGLDQPLPVAEQATREAEQMANHCNALPDHVLPMLVDVQRLRDASLAAAAKRALEQTGGPVVVITGNGHARLDRGLAVYLQRALPDVVIRALGQMEEGAIQGQFDVVLSAPTVQRPDPCLGFAKSD
ncbi:ChaN family lipoprotein [Pseudophaeobacter sp.]|uniref:ChaN family lipoprotein n=1 Tax=Pseudophaeobacter sp. TaxID=1971739 RepID=UPI0025F728F2|nr:ChaN family lipoprotein [uncultured Pseudophaeobacter sp.]